MLYFIVFDLLVNSTCISVIKLFLIVFCVGLIVLFGLHYWLGCVLLVLLVGASASGGSGRWSWLRVMSLGGAWVEVLGS